MERKEAEQPEEEYLIDAIEDKNINGVNNLLSTIIYSQEILDEGLISACAVSIPDIVKSLLENGADPHTENDKPCFIAFCRGNNDIIQIFLNKIPSLFESQEFLLNIMEYMIESIEEENKTICDKTISIETLIRLGLDIHYHDDKFLWNAIEKGKINIAKVLLNHGANPNTVFELENDPEGTNYNCLQLAGLLLRWEIIPKLIEKGAEGKDDALVLAIENLNEIDDENMYDIYGTITALINFHAKITDEEVLLFIVEKYNDLGIAPDVKFSIKNMINLLVSSAVDSLSNPAIEEVRTVDGLSQDAIDALDSFREKNSERTQRALGIEAANEAKRQEYKHVEEKSTAGEKVNTYCHSTSHGTLMGDNLLDTDDFVVFVRDDDSSQKGDCYLRSELKELYEQSENVYEFMGPPFGVSKGSYTGPRGPNLDNKVFKLPWSGVWVTKEVIELGINSEENWFELSGKKMSIGNRFEMSGLHGQFGGHWKKEGDRAVYVESGDAKPDDRFIVYDHKSVRKV